MNSIKFCLFKIACYIGKFSRISYCSLIHSTWAACEELGLKVCLTSQCHNYLKDKLFRESAKESWRESQLNHVNQYCNQCCIGILQMQLAREHPIWLWKSNLLYFANRFWTQSTLSFVAFGDEFHSSASRITSTGKRNWFNWMFAHVFSFPVPLNYTVQILTWTGLGNKSYS